MATVVREIERKYDPAAGGTAALDAVKTITGARPATATKPQRALAGRLPAAGAVRESPPLTRHSPAGEVVLAYGLMHQRQACQAATIEQALPRFTAAQRDRTTRC